MIVPWRPRRLQDRLIAPALFIDGDVLNQQTQYTFFVFGLGAGRMPERRKVLSQRQDLGILLGRRHPGLTADKRFIAGLHLKATLPVQFVIMRQRDRRLRGCLREGAK